MNAMDVTQHVENLLTGETIPASTAEWLRQAFTRHIDGESSINCSRLVKL